MTISRHLRAVVAVIASLSACASSTAVRPTNSQTVAQTNAAAAAATTGAPSPTSRSATTSATLALSSDGLAATLEQYRADEVTHLLEIQVINRSGRAVRLSDLRLDWPGLVPVAPATRNDLVSDGQVVDLPVAYGEALCASPPRGDEPTPDAPATVVATARWNDAGDPQPVRFPVTDSRGILPRLFEPSCRRQSITGVVELSWSTDWTDATSPAGRLVGRGELRLHRRAGTQPVRIVRLRGSVVLAVDPTPEVGLRDPLVVLERDQVDAVLPVLIGQTGSCADHVLSQSSQTFLLPVTVVVGDGAEVTIDVVPDVAAQNQLLSIASRACTG